MEASELVSSITGLKVPKTHATVGLTNLIACHNDYRTLFVNRRLPDRGWSDIEIQHLLFTLSTLDTNKKHQLQQSSSSSSSLSSKSRWCGVGEREGRIYSSLVSMRHFGMSHGIGRSGDISEPQPKAVGSTVLAKLTLLLTLDAIRRATGLKVTHGLLLPLCTGMSLSLVLTCLRQQSTDKQTLDPSRRVVLWSRMDQKSCFKAIQSAGLICVVIPTKLQGDEVVTDFEALKKAIDEYANEVLAVVTTTSCFAPRAPDQVDQVAQICAAKNIYHVINHAYGLQCAKTCQLINRASTIGRVDAIVCSTDKNFLVPVGGALVLSTQGGSLTEEVARAYAGRASSSPIVDLFITLLAMGLHGYKKLLADRMALVDSFVTRLDAVAQKHGERILFCPSNTISFGITLDTLAAADSTRQNLENGDEQQQEDNHDHDQEADTSKLATSASPDDSNNISGLGAMLFSRCVSGTRVVVRGEMKRMGHTEFRGFGSSTDNYPHHYLTAACAIGVDADEIDEFLRRLDKALMDFKKKKEKKKPEHQETNDGDKS